MIWEKYQMVVYQLSLPGDIWKVLWLDGVMSFDFEAELSADSNVTRQATTLTTWCSIWTCEWYNICALQYTTINRVRLDMAWSSIWICERYNVGAEPTRMQLPNSIQQSTHGFDTT
jgi:hypothetical protein